MPYFVYKISPPRQLECLETAENYREARAILRSRREAEARANGVEYRLIFAKQPSEAETRLSVQRDLRPTGEDRQVVAGTPVRRAIDAAYTHDIT